MHIHRHTERFHLTNLEKFASFIQWICSGCCCCSFFFVIVENIPVTRLRGAIKIVVMDIRKHTGREMLGRKVQTNKVAPEANISSMTTTTTTSTSRPANFYTSGDTF